MPPKPRLLPAFGAITAWSRASMIKAADYFSTDHKGNPPPKNPSPDGQDNLREGPVLGTYQGPGTYDTAQPAGRAFRDRPAVRRGYRKTWSFWPRVDLVNAQVLKSGGKLYPGSAFFLTRAGKLAHQAGPGGSAQMGRRYARRTFLHWQGRIKEAVEALRAGHRKTWRDFFLG